MVILWEVMNNPNYKTKSLIAILLALWLIGFIPSGTAFAESNPNTTTTTTIVDFASSIQKTDSETLVGLYSQDKLAVTVVQQPSAVSAYVSNEDDAVTQFGLATKYGSVGLLAHNTLAGRYFSNLSIGTVITLVYGDGSLHYYLVSSVKRYQALTPNSTTSNFIDLGNPGTSLTSTDLFYKTFGLKDRLVLQTCILKDGNPSWGRLFVIATEVEKPVHNYKYYDLATVLK
jgi:hypothetical protein